MSGVDDEVYSQPVASESPLILTPSYDYPFTTNRETDVRTAAIRGLAQYMRAQVIPWSDGRELRLLKVYESWADLEEQSLFPAATIYSTEPGNYDAAAFTSRLHVIDNKDTIRPTVLRIPSEYVQTLQVDILANSKVDRMGLIALFEDVFDPVEWMSGFRLRLPHYHNAVCSYLKTDLLVVDSAEEASKRMRLATFSITAVLPQIRLVGTVPGLDPRVVAELTP